MPQETKEEDKEYDHGVIHAKVVEVAFYSGGGFADRVRARER